MMRRLFGLIGWVTLLAQAYLGVRVALRLVRTARGTRIERRSASTSPERCSVLVPVLNEAKRLEPCLQGIIGSGSDVAEILVIDGGSTDGTRLLVERYAARDTRIRFIDASPIPDNWNGKAWGLQVGAEESNPGTDWLLTLDADVRPDRDLVPSLIAHARHERVDALSAATVQTLSGAAEGLVHPALLATLVYRFGIPGHVATGVADTQANGQSFLIRRGALERSGGFSAVRGSVCEDVTLARNLVAAGGRVGFYETADLVSVSMYAGWRDAVTNWTRSLPLRDDHWGIQGLANLAEVVAVQAAPVPLVIALAASRRSGTDRRLMQAAWMLNIWLAVMRFGVLAGMSRAYRARPLTYWLSPVTDVPVAAMLIMSARRRAHSWRGRTFVRASADADG